MVKTKISLTDKTDDSESSDEEFIEWVKEDPRHLRFAMIAYWIFDTMKLLYVFLLTSVGVVIAYSTLPQLPTGVAALWVVIAIGIGVIVLDTTIDRFTKSPKVVFSWKLGFPVLVGLAQIYMQIKTRKSVDQSKLASVFSKEWVEHPFDAGLKEGPRTLL